MGPFLDLVNYLDIMLLLKLLRVADSAKGENVIMTKTLDRQTAKFLGVFIEHAPGLDSREMQYWIERPQELAMALREATKLTRVQRTFHLQPGTEITVGGWEPDKLRAWMRDKRIYSEVMQATYAPEFSFSESSRQVTFGCKKVRDFGFTEHTSYEDVMEYVSTIGGLCDLEDAVYLLMHLGNSTDGRSMVLASEPYTWDERKNNYLSLFDGSINVRRSYPHNLKDRASPDCWIIYRR